MAKIGTIPLSEAHRLSREIDAGEGRTRTRSGYVEFGGERRDVTDFCITEAEGRMAGTFGLVGVGTRYPGPSADAIVRVRGQRDRWVPAIAQSIDADTGAFELELGPEAAGAFAHPDFRRAKVRVRMPGGGRTTIVIPAGAVRVDPETGRIRGHLAGNFEYHALLYG